jgi:hypothetical protein
MFCILPVESLGEHIWESNLARSPELLGDGDKLYKDSPMCIASHAMYICCTVVIQGPVGADHDKDFRDWMESVGLGDAHRDDQILNDYMNFELKHDNANMEDDDEEARCIPCAPATHAQHAAPAPSTMLTAPWTTPTNIRVEPDNTGLNIIDMGPSTPKYIGKIHAQMTDGGVRAVCKMRDHGDQPDSPCYIWLTAPGHYQDAVACISEWFQGGLSGNLSKDDHRKDAATQRVRFTSYVWLSAMHSISSHHHINVLKIMKSITDDRHIQCMQHQFSCE